VVSTHRPDVPHAGAMAALHRLAKQVERLEGPAGGEARDVPLPGAVGYVRRLPGGLLAAILCDRDENPFTCVNTLRLLEKRVSAVCKGKEVTVVQLMKRHAGTAPAPAEPMPRPSPW